MLFMQMLRSSRNVLDLMLGHLVNSSLGWIELYAPQLSEAAETGVDHIIHVNQTKVLVLVIYVFSWSKHSRLSEKQADKVCLQKPV